MAALLAAGSTLAVANVVLMVAALAGHRPLRVAGAWGLAVLAGAVAAVVLDRVVAGAPDGRSSSSSSEVVATAALAVVAWRLAQARPAGLTATSSTDEP